MEHNRPSESSKPHDQHAQEHTHAHGHDCCGCDHEHGHGHHEHAHSHGHSHSHKQKLGPLFYLELCVLVVWGLALLAFMVNGKVVYYLTTAGILREQAFIGGLLLLVLAAFNFAMRHRTCDCGHDHSHDHSHDHAGQEAEEGEGHQHHHHEPGNGSRLVTVLLLIGTVGYAWAESPESYSVELQTQMANSITAQVNSGRRVNKAMAANGEYTIETFRKMMGVSAEGPIPLDTQSFFYNGNDPTMRKILDGQPIELVGRVVKNTIGSKPNRLRVYDEEVSCCAADARPFSFPIQFNEKPGDYTERGWYKLRGTMRFEEERNHTVSVLHVDSMEPTTRPASAGRMW